MASMIWMVARRAGALSMSLALAVACGTTPPSRHYVLTALADRSAETAPTSDIGLAVGPVSLPGYLDRPQLVSDMGSNERGLDELSRWAEPLDAGMARVLRENLATLLGSEQVLPWPSDQADDLRFRLAVEVLRFEAEPEAGVARLQLRWTLFADRASVLVQRVDLQQAVTGKTQGDIVAALSGLLATFCEQVAAQVRDLVSQPHGN